MDIKKTVSEMTVADKARLLCGTSPFSIGGFESAAGTVPELNMQDGGTGINFEHLFGHCIIDEELTKKFSPEEGMNVIRNFYDADKLTAHEKELREELNSRLVRFRDGIETAPGCYPPGILLAATWNPDVVYETGRALGMEASVYHVGVLLGTPNCNILREPVNGRFFEGYSEDPFLAASLAPQMCKGVESMGVASDVKHFACNNLEINRKVINELVSVRALREIYFPAFEACCKVASTLMTAYPSINGIHCSENSWLLNDVLRNEWGYEGVTITDWDGVVRDSGDSVAAGQDVFMPGPWDPSAIIKAAEDGRLSLEDLDNVAERVLSLIDRFSGVKAPDGLTDEKYKETGDKAAYDAAAEGIVMLRNDSHMPLDKDSKVVFFCPGLFRICGTGSAQVMTDRATDLFTELGSILGEENVLRDDYDAFLNGATAIVIETIESGEGADRPGLNLDLQTRSLIERLGRNRGEGKICLILNTPGPVELQGIEETVDSVFAVFYPGMMGAKAMADIITGKVNPSGALPCTFPVSYKDTPAYLCYPDSLTCNYGEGIFVGYRGYDKRGIKPLYSFGYGLSYSEFTVDQIRSFRTGDKIHFECRVSNNGAMDGKTVVQLYVKKAVPQIPRAVRELKAFKKVFVRGNDASLVEMVFDTNELAYFDEEYDKFLTEGGRYELYIRLSGNNTYIYSGTMEIDGSEELKCGPSWTLRQIAGEKELTDALKKDCEALGLSYMDFTANLQYVPSMKLSEVYEDTSGFEFFNRAAGSFRPR